MPRIKSARGRLATIINEDLERLGDAQRTDPKFRLTVKDAMAVKLLAQADAILQKRTPSEDEVEDQKAAEETAGDLVKKLTGARQANPTATAFRGEESDDTGQ